MFERLLPARRRRPPRDATRRVDRRTAPPAPREPTPMPRMRWYA